MIGFFISIIVLLVCVKVSFMVPAEYGLAVLIIGLFQVIAVTFYPLYKINTHHLLDERRLSKQRGKKE